MNALLQGFWQFTLILLLIVLLAFVGAGAAVVYPTCWVLFMMWQAARQHGPSVLHSIWRLVRWLGLLALMIGMMICAGFLSLCMLALFMDGAHFMAAIFFFAVAFASFYISKLAQELLK